MAASARLLWSGLAPLVVAINALGPLVRYAELEIGLSTVVPTDPLGEGHLAVAVARIAVTSIDRINIVVHIFVTVDASVGAVTQLENLGRGVTVRALGLVVSSIERKLCDLAVLEPGNVLCLGHAPCVERMANLAVEQ